MPKYWLAYDIGTTSTKIALLDEMGKAIKNASATYPTHTAEGGIVEQSAADWWNGFVRATQEIDATKVVPAADLAGIVLTGQMQDMVMIDAANNVIRPVILYSDMRATEESNLINNKVGVLKLRRVTGNDQTGSSILAKLLWLKKHEPATIEKTVKMLLGGADYIVYKLTGNTVSDTTTASTTGILDIAQRKIIAADILEAIGLSDCVRMFPKIVPGGALVGAVSAEHAELLKVPVDLPVYLAPGDAGSVTVGAGSGESGVISCYIGTSGWVAFSAKNVRLMTDTGVFTIAHPRFDSYIYVAPLLTAGGNLEFARKLFGNREYPELIEEAMQQPISPILYLPYLNGERSPFTDANARGAFIGMSARHTHADLVRAVLEGVAFGYRHAFEALTDVPVTSLVLTGGGTKSMAWAQMFADVTGLEARIPAEPSNVALRGAVISAEVANAISLTYVPSGRFPIAQSLMPDPAKKAEYDKKYANYLAAYPALKALFSQMA